MIFDHFTPQQKLKGARVSWNATILSLIIVGIFSTLNDEAQAQVSRCGMRNFNGTQVQECVTEPDRRAVLSNSCGTEILDVYALSRGAVPTTIVPCPRPGSNPSRDQPPSMSKADCDLKWLMAKADLQSYITRNTPDVLNAPKGLVDYDLAEVRTKCLAVNQDAAEKIANITPCLRAVADLKYQIAVIAAEEKPVGLDAVYGQARRACNFDPDLLSAVRQIKARIDIKRQENANNQDTCAAGGGYLALMPVQDDTGQRVWKRVCQPYAQGSGVNRPGQSQSTITK
jgi:hypothetical protein